MTIRECYDAMGGNYADVEGRLKTEARIQKFLLRVLNDASYDLLCTSIEEQNTPEAFRAAHTIKGICQNLSLDRLFKSADCLSELLRNRQEYGEDLEPALEQLKEDYQLTISCIKQLA